MSEDNSSHTNDELLQQLRTHRNPTEGEETMSTRTITGNLATDPCKKHGATFDLEEGK